MIDKDISYSIKTLADLSTRINYFLEISDLAVENEEYLNKVRHKGFFSKILYQKSISTLSLNFIIITACSFIDEYETQLNSKEFPKFSDEINKLKLINKPAIRRIKRWKDLKKYRNNILAHNLRYKNKPIYSYSEKIEYNFPHHNNEVELLSKLVLTISKNIGEVFPDLIKGINYNKKLSDNMSVKINNIDEKEELNTILFEIQKIKAEIL